MGLGEMKQRSIFSLLGLCIVGSAVGAASTVLVLEPEDRISVTRGAFLTVLGFIFFLSLFDFLNHVALKTAPGLRIRKKYQLTMGEVLDISNKVVSAVQAALSCFTGAVVCLWSCTRDLLHSSHFMSEAYAWFGAAYFFYDIWSMYKVHIYMNAGAKFNAKAAKSKMMGKGSGKGLGGGGSGELRANGDGVLSVGDLDMPSKQKAKKEVTTFLAYCKNEPVILMHHLFIGGFGFLVIVYLRGGLGDCIFGFVYLMELSTPFVSVRGILSHMKLKSSQLYVANGVAMLVTFFVCRIVMLPYVCYMYSSMIGLPYFEAIMLLPTGCKISIMLLLLPQIYWFYLMVRGAYKVFFPPKPRLESETACPALQPTVRPPTPVDAGSEHAASGSNKGSYHR